MATLSGGRSGAKGADADGRAGAARLAERVRRYDPEALLELFEGSVDRVHGLAFALSGDEELAGELTRLSFLRALDRLRERSAAAGSIEDWMLWVAARVCLDGLLKGAPWDPGEQAPSYPSRRLAGIPRAPREALVLKEVGRLSVAAIATATGRWEGWVRLLLEWGARRMEDRGQELAGLPQPPASPSLRLRLRTIFLAEAAQRRVAWVHRHQLRLVAARRPRQRRLRALSLLVTVVILVLAAVLGVVTAVGAGFSDPGSPLYSLKRGGEDILLTFTSAGPSRALLDVSLATERLKEAEVVSSRGDAAGAIRLVASRNDDLLDGARTLSQDQAHDSSWLAAGGRLKAEASEPLAMLEKSLQDQGDAAAASRIRSMEAAFQARWSRASAPLTPRHGSEGHSPTSPS